MQRWKVCGEVLDSDDEDVGLSAQSQSPHQPRKKQRLDDGDDARGQHDHFGGQAELGDGGGLIADDEEEWLLPEVARTYRKGAHGSRPASMRDGVTSELPQSSDDGTRASRSLDVFQARCVEKDDRDSQQPHSIPSDDLPDLDDLFRQPKIGANQHSEDDSPLSSLPPSPVLEATSPPTQTNLQALSHKPGEDVHDSDPTDLLGLRANEPMMARRTFRARKEKQLHPYMFDLAQYQKQFKDRGLRPVRYVDTQQAGEDTQMSDPNAQKDNRPGSSPADSTSSMELSQSSVCNVVDHDGNGAGHNSALQDSDDDLPGVNTLIDKGRAGILPHPNKRRKLLKTSNAVNSPFERLVSPMLQTIDDLSVPPSPPPTSTRSVAAPQNVPQAVRFRFPRGHTPKPLPTPDVSSEARGIAHEGSEALSDDDFEWGSVPTPAPRRLQRPNIQVQCSSDSTDQERPPERIDLRLKRERKRIRGVLPASWLKLDLQAQRQTSVSPSRTSPQRSESPSAGSPQKGVARLVRTANNLASSAAVPISDDEDDTISRHSSISPPRMRQSRIHFDRAQTSTIAANDLVDDERMEIDWIDPMFAASSRKKRADTGARRQLKITEAWSSGHRRMDEYFEERLALNRLAAHSPKRARQRRPTKHHRLSILDAPSQTPTHSCAPPPFIRLAMRAARHRPDEGRHSPIQKQIRLSTKDDTQDASATLQEWREGTIVPVQGEIVRHGHADLDKTDLDHENHSAHISDLRIPLAELPRNVRMSPKNLQSKTSIEQRHGGRHASHSRRPRMQQTRLEPVRLERQVRNRQPSMTLMATNRPSRTASRRDQPSGVPQSAQFRDAQLESLESAFDLQHHSAAFERRIHMLTENVTRGRQGHEVSGFRIERFLDNGSHAADSFAGAGQSPKKPDLGQPGNLQYSRTLPRRPKKQQARRINTESLRYRQPNEPLPAPEQSGQSTTATEARSHPRSVLQGLGPFGTKYATDFDVIPLAVGTFFHESSFIGSGDFAASLNLMARDLSVDNGRINIHIESDVLEWGPWTEDVAVGVKQVSKAISEILKPLHGGSEDSDGNCDVPLAVANVDYLLRSVVRYISRCLVFLDPVDRRSCVSHLVALVEDILELLAGSESPQDQGGKDAATRCLQYATVIGKQATMLCQHDAVISEVKIASTDVMAKAAYRLARSSFPDRMADLRTFLEKNRCMSSRETGMRDDETTVCSVVILHHVLHNDAVGAEAFWATIDQSLNTDAGSLSMVARLDNAWYGIFTILPFLEIDIRGHSCTGSRMNANEDNWTSIKRFVDCTLELYPTSSSIHGSTVNDYIRAVLRRCFQLITRWGWWRCESMLGSIFDFFAKRGLAELHKEDSHRSPVFLQTLDGKPSLEVQPEDRSFTIFLKVLASALQGMRKHHLYSEKKIGAIAWRFIPNHGRTSRKDAEVRQDDLDALRNHHDLLCTLYYASPPAHRLRVVLLQQLVDHSMSHREACRLSVRAWSNLASFQASTDEPIDKLDSFIQWFSDMLNTTIAQYRLARTEIEQEATSNRLPGALPVPRAVIEDTIARNQRQIVATLVDLLASLKRVLQASRSLDAAAHLLKRTTFWRIYEIFEPSSRLLHGMLDESLEVFAAALRIQAKFDSASQTQNSDEDSQDYGDSSALLEFASTQAVPHPVDQKILDILHGPLAQLVSDTFGADVSMEDALTVKLLDGWTAFANVMVKADKRTLNNYINDYTSEAWVQLRETEHKQKFTPYFLSRMVELTDVDIVETGVLRSWLVSLVDREAMLKYQHRLTCALLEQHTDSPLLHNLPFSRNATGMYAITMHDLRHRRLSLLSIVLSNMHVDISLVQLERPHAAHGLRRRYAELLKRLMQAMKQNYQDLQVTSASEVASADVQGSYVEFVQHVVSSMQQYTTDICQIDRFFTDSSAFPLPATDPMYVVGRLRAYTPKLAESRKRKELSVLIQSVNERAAVDGQQTYLVAQLITAMTGGLELGRSNSPSLRRILLTSVCPAYIEAAMSTTCSWIVARPILKACGPALANLLYTIVFEDKDSIQCGLEMLETVLRSMTKPLNIALARPDFVRVASVQSLLTSIFESARRCLTIVKSLSTSMEVDGRVTNLIHFFSESAAAFESYLIDGDEFSLMIDRPSGQDVPSPWSDTLEFSRKQVYEKLKNDWHAADGQYYMKRGNTSVEVTVPLGDEDEVQGAFLDSTKVFRRSYVRIFEERSERDCGDSLIGLVV